VEHGDITILPIDMINQQANSLTKTMAATELFEAHRKANQGW